MNKKETKNVIIISPYGSDELLNPKHGGSKLIQMQKQYLEEKGYLVKFISLTEFRGFVPLLLKFIGNKKDFIMDKKIGEKRYLTWFLNLLFRIFIYYLQKLDVIFRQNVKKIFWDLCNNQNCVILNNYGYVDVNVISQKCKKIMFAHNVEFDFFRQLTGDKSYCKLFLLIFKKIEKKMIKLHDITCCLTKEDQRILLRETKQKNIVVWVPLPYPMQKMKQPDNTSEMNKNRFVVGFVGAFFDPNIEAVKKIMGIASKVKRSEIKFLIIGSVGKAFIKESLPKNVQLTGWVNDIDTYLQECDVFLNPKQSVKGGLEMKVLDYLKYFKPIITTSNGARGFPLTNTNSIIDDEVESWHKYILLLADNPELRIKIVNNLKSDYESFCKRMDDIFEKNII